MKKYVSLLMIYSFSILSGCSSSDNNEQLSAVNAENGSLFSIRNLQSGFMIYNALNQQGFETRGWELVPGETPVEALVHSPGGWVQFKDPGSDNCLAALGGRSLSKATCDIKNKETLFVLIPSTTGAVQIQSVSSGTCIIDKGDTDNFQFGRCIADVQRPYLTVPEKNLWMLNPPVVPSSMAPVTI